MKKLLFILLLLVGYCTNQSIAALKLTCPNGGEEFSIASDTLITWEGVLPTDSVTIEYSTDKGINWELITDNATGLKYIWKNIPAPESKQCLIKVKSNKKQNPPEIEWQKNYGGKDNDHFYCIQNTSDGGYIVCGDKQFTYDDGKDKTFSYSGWLLKLDSYGNIEWEKVITSGFYNPLHSVIQTSDGGYAATGITDNGESLWLIKFDKFGNQEWETVYKYQDNKKNIGYSIVQKKDGGYVITGQTIKNNQSEKCLIVFFNKFGEVEYSSINSKYSISLGFALQQTKDNGYIVGGIATNLNTTKYGYMFIKLDSIGITEWQQFYSDSISAPDYLNDIKQTRDGGYIATGSHFQINMYRDMFLIKLDDKGNKVWMKKFGGSYDEGGQSLLITNDGDYIVAGYCQSNDGDVIKNAGKFDCWIVRLDNSGIIKWQKSIGGNQLDCFIKIQQTKDGGLIAAGYSESTNIEGIKNNGSFDGYIVKLAPVDESDISDSVFSIVAPPIFVKVKNDSAYAGQVRQLKLVANNIKSEELSKIAKNFSAKIRFQKTILTPVKRADRTIVNDSIYVNISGTIGSSLELAKISVIAGLGLVDKTALDIVDFKLYDYSGNESTYPIKKQSGVFKLLGICRENGTRFINPTGKAEIILITPNPARERVEINVNLIEDGYSTLSIYNVNGVRLREYYLNEGTGTNSINIDLNDFANGLYFIQLKTPTIIDNQKLMIVK